MDEETEELLPPEGDLVERVCPECKGQAYDRRGDPCDFCHAEGVILVFP